MDAVSNGLITTTYPHHEVHEGASFRCVAVDTTLDDTETLSLAFQTPAGTKRAHMLIGWATAGAAHVELLEGPTWDDQSGTAAVIWNRFRDTPGSSVLLEDQAQAAFTASDALHMNPTTLAGGDSIELGRDFSSTKNTSQNRGSAEWVLDPGVQYAILLTSDVNGSSGFIELDWYEHTDSH